jgi:hypothetical protein
VTPRNPFSVEHSTKCRDGAVYGLTGFVGETKHTVEVLRADLGPGVDNPAKDHRRARANNFPEPLEAVRSVLGTQPRWSKLRENDGCAECLCRPVAHDLLDPRGVRVGPIDQPRPRSTVTLQRCRQAADVTVLSVS